MKTEVKEKWVKALRSGKYRQTNGMLYKEWASSGPSFCALGVLAEIASHDGILDINESATGNDRFGAVPVDRLLPEAVCQWAELGSDEEMEVMQENDRMTTDFEDVAGLIEENF